MVKLILNTLNTLGTVLIDCELLIIFLLKHQRQTSHVLDCPFLVALEILLERFVEKLIHRDEAC